MAGTAKDNDGSVDDVSCRSNMSPGQVGISPPAESRARAKDFATQLTEEERMLVVLRRELYEGYSSGGVAAVSTDGQPELATKRHAGWQAMLKDLSNRLEGRPYIFKLANRIRDDIARIEKLRAFEEEYNVDLADFVESPASGRKPLR